MVRALMFTGNVQAALSLGGDRETRLEAMEDELHDDDDHDRGLAFDLSTLLTRRRALQLFGGASLVALVGCASKGSSTATTAAASGSSGSSATAATSAASTATTAAAATTATSAASTDTSTP